MRWRTFDFYCSATCMIALTLLTFEHDTYVLYSFESKWYIWQSHYVYRHSTGIHAASIFGVGKLHFCSQKWQLRNGEKILESRNSQFYFVFRSYFLSFQNFRMFVNIVGSQDSFSMSFILLLRPLNSLFVAIFL